MVVNNGMSEEEIKEVISAMVEEGIIEFVGIDEDGEIVLRLADQEEE